MTRTGLPFDIVENKGEGSGIVTGVIIRISSVSTRVMNTDLFNLRDFKYFTKKNVVLLELAVGTPNKYTYDCTKSDLRSNTDTFTIREQVFLTTLQFMSPLWTFTQKEGYLSS